MLNLHKSESGRSIVEIIAILVLMMLLILTGLWGFKHAVLSARVQTISKDLSTAVTERRYEIARSGTSKPHKLTTKVGSTEMTIQNRTEGERDFFITITTTTPETCEEMKKYNVFKPKAIGAKKKTGEYIEPTVLINEINCAEISALDFYFDPSNGGGHGGNGGGNGGGGAGGEDDNPLGGNCDGKNCGDCKRCDAMTGQCVPKEDNTKIRDCGICKNGEVKLDTSIHTPDCQECSAGTDWSFKNLNEDSPCREECGRCHSGSCTHVDEITVKVFDGDCCNKQHTYCPVTDPDPENQCTADKEKVETVTNGTCETKITKNACDNVTVLKTEYPNNNAFCGSCGQCTNGSCVEQSQNWTGRTWDPGNTNCCKDSATYTYCPLKGESAPETCAGNKTETTTTGESCARTTVVTDQCTNNVVSTTYPNNGTSCGECGDGVCTNGSCIGGAKKLFNYYTTINGSCQETSGQFCSQPADTCTPCPTSETPPTTGCYDTVTHPEANGCPAYTTYTSRACCDGTLQGINCCPTGWTADSNGHCYRYFGNVTSAPGAAGYCSSQGARLPTIAEMGSNTIKCSSIAADGWSSWSKCGWAWNYYWIGYQGHYKSENCPYWYSCTGGAYAYGGCNGEEVAQGNNNPMPVCCVKW